MFFGMQDWERTKTTRAKSERNEIAKVRDDKRAIFYSKTARNQHHRPFKTRELLLTMVATDVFHLSSSSDEEDIAIPRKRTVLTNQKNKKKIAAMKKKNSMKTTKKVATPTIDVDDSSSSSSSDSDSDDDNIEDAAGELRVPLSIELIH